MIVLSIQVKLMLFSTNIKNEHDYENNVYDFIRLFQICVILFSITAYFIVTF